MNKKNIILNGTIFLFLIFSLVGYIFQVSALTEENYLIERSQETINSYSREGEVLEYEFFQTNSFFEVENLALEFNFQPAEKVSYIEVFGTEVVVK